MQTQTDACPVKEYSEWKQRPGIQPGLVEGLLAPHWDDFAATMFERGYSWYTIRRTIEIAKPFAAYAKGNGIGSAADLTPEVVDGYLKQRKLRESLNCLRLLMGYLGDNGILKMVVAPSEPPSPLLLEEYRKYLHGHRGIGEQTIKAHCSHVQALLATLGERAEPTTIKGLSASRTAKPRKPSWSRSRAILQRKAQRPWDWCCCWSLALTSEPSASQRWRSASSICVSRPLRTNSSSMRCNRFRKSR